MSFSLWHLVMLLGSLAVVAGVVVLVVAMVRSFSRGVQEATHAADERGEVDGPPQA